MRAGHCCRPESRGSFQPVKDPNPQVAGRGHDTLKEAGIECAVGIGAERAQAMNRGFWKRMTTGKPWVCVKQAMSLDGGTALADGTSQWITSRKARADVQWQRARSGAVLSTAATVRRDDARLNVRLDAKEMGVDQVRQPLRVVMDRKGELSEPLALWSEPGPCVVYTLGEHAPKLRSQVPAEAEVRTVRAAGKGLDLDEVLSSLAADYEVNDVLVEAGAKFVGALIEEDLVDELMVYVAPRLLGTDAAPLATLQRLKTCGACGLGATGRPCVGARRAPDLPPESLMFTGIVEARGQVVAAEATDSGRRVRIQHPGQGRLKEVRAGGSVAVNGVCLTACVAEAESSMRTWATRRLSAPRWAIWKSGTTSTWNRLCVSGNRWEGIS